MKTYALVILGILAVWWLKVAINIYTNPHPHNEGMFLALIVVGVISLIVLFPVAVVGGFL